MIVKRLFGTKGGEGRVEIIDDNGVRWEVPVVKTRDGKRFLAAQTEYESDIGVTPSFELMGNLNDAVREFVESNL